MFGAVEPGGTKFVAAVADRDGAIVARARFATTNPDENFAQLRAFFTEAQATHGAIAAFGIGSFGPVCIDPNSPDFGTFGGSPKPGWPGARWRDALDGFDAPVAIDTDVDAAALGEWVAGAGKGCETLAYTTVGTGVGTGIVHHGRSRIGFTHYESGHTWPPHDRERDPFAGLCPFHGDCLEGLAAGPAIAARWGASLSELNDPAATELIADYLGHLAATLVLLHAPDRLIFGGGVMKAPGLLAALRKATEARLSGYMHDARLDPGLERYLVAPALGDDAGITGAILLARQALEAD